MNSFNDSFYNRLKGNLFHDVKEDYIYEGLFSERILRCIWQEKLLNNKLWTVNKEEFEVVFPGNWNVGEGPDFKGAVIKFANEPLIRGDVEIHKKLSDWNTHKHSEDSQFSNVILNVAFFNDGGKDYVSSPIGLKIRQLEMKDFLKKSLKELICEIDVDNYPVSAKVKVGLCCGIIEKERNKFYRLINAAGDERFFNKVRRFTTEVNNIGYESTIYRGFMESLGYKSNKKQFRKLSELISLVELRNVISSSSNEDEMVNIIQSLFFYFSGLLDYYSVRDLEGESGEFLNHLRKQKEIWEKNLSVNIEKMRSSDWVFSGVRPTNLPERGIAGASLFFIKYLPLGLDKWLFSKVDELKYCLNNSKTKLFINNLYEEIIQKPYGFWEKRLVIGSCADSKGIKLIGKEKALTIILNLFLPILYVYGESGNDSDLKEKVMNLYNEFPVLQSNRISRLMQYRFFGTQEFKMLNERIQQGIIHIFYDVCEDNIWNCENCSFPRMFNLI